MEKSDELSSETDDQKQKQPDNVRDENSNGSEDNVSEQVVTYAIGSDEIVVGGEEVVVEDFEEGGEKLSKDVISNEKEKETDGGNEPEDNESGNGVGEVDQFEGRTEDDQEQGRNSETASIEQSEERKPEDDLRSRLLISKNGFNVEYLHWFNLRSDGDLPEWLRKMIVDLKFIPQALQQQIQHLLNRNYQFQTIL